MRTRVRLHYKDAILNRLSETANVAQFVSFGPDERQRHAWVHGFAPNHRFPTLTSAVEALLGAASDRSINVRSFTPESPKSREFIYGLKTVDDVTASIRRLALQGLHTIANETIDVHDGGVSGVAFGGILEIAPGDTPRAVEKSGTAALPQELGTRLLQTVYGFRPALEYGQNLRIEFSIHPIRRGFRHEHTIVWESEEVEGTRLATELSWPNLFSRMIGDKVFGLLVADQLGLPVPKTTVISRALPTFSFGRPTDTQEWWIRTSPFEQVPGRFTTQRGWRDPFLLVQAEDPRGEMLASVLAQEGIDAAYSGAAIADKGGSLIVEGTRGYGDRFMLGQAKEHLPEDVEASVFRLYQRIDDHLGPSRFEWVYDGRTAWIVQLHRGATFSSGRTIYPGVAETLHPFKVDQGLEALRNLIGRIRGSEDGIVLVGDVGVTSHFGDLLRQAKIASYIEPLEGKG